MNKEKPTREQIADLLPHALHTALTKYQKFLDEDPGEKVAKNFKLKQEACKVALAHVELLLKLIDQYAIDHKSEPDLALLIKNAQEELNNYNKGGTDV